MRRIVGWLLVNLLLGGLGGAATQESLGRIALELEGPQDELRLTSGGVETVLRLFVRAGERRRFEVPFVAAARPGTAARPPRFVEARVPAGAQLLPATLELPPEWSQLPPGLRSRALPPVARPPQAADGLRLSWIVAALLVVSSLRRRPFAALALGALAAAGLFALPAPVVSAPVVRVLEGEAGSGRWLEVRGARERLQLSEHEPGWVHQLPRSARAELEVRERGGQLEWSWSAPAARVYALREVSLAGPTRADPGTFAFRRSWSRSPSGEWTAHGPWKALSGLPAPAPDLGSPPGWLASGLPQGRGILVGELDLGGEEQAWMRLVGFE